MNSDIDAEEIKGLAKKYRAAAGLTQRQLAAKVETSPGVIGELERGRVRSRRVAKLVRALALADVAEV